MAKTAKTKAKAVAKKGAGAVQSVAAEALGAAAVTAAGVVLTRVAEGMGAGAKRKSKRRRRLSRPLRSKRRRNPWRRRKSLSARKLRPQRRGEKSNAVNSKLRLSNQEPLPDRCSRAKPAGVWRVEKSPRPCSLARGGAGAGSYQCMLEVHRPFNRLA